MSIFDRVRRALSGNVILVSRVSQVSEYSINYEQISLWNFIKNADGLHTHSRDS
jgi:hypothetical protein